MSHPNLAKFDASADRILAALRKRWLTVIVSVFVVVAFILSLNRHHIILDTAHIFFWLTLFMLATGMHRFVGAGRTLVRDWTPLFLVMFGYDYLRGYVAQVNTTVRWEPQLAIDVWLGGGHSVVTRLQDAWWLGEPRALDYMLVIVYLTHFFIPLGIAAILWIRARPLYLRYTGRLVALFLAAVVTYALYPAAPPWMAGQVGRMDHVDRVITVSMASIEARGPAPDSFPLHADGLYNPVAALPSLHAAIPVLFLLLFWKRASRWLRGVLLTYPLAMGFTLVYSGEHYVFDVLVGWVYAVVVVVVANKLGPRLRNAFASGKRNGDEPASAQEVAPALEIAGR